MTRIAKAAALFLVSAGGFLMYRGLHGYFDSQEEQREAAVEWSNLVRPTPTPPDLSTRRAPPDNERNIPQGSPISEMNFPRFRRSFFVVEGSDPQSLRKGPGHVRGSAMPGENGNCVIAGHRDVQFRFLKDIRSGDEVYLQTTSGKYRYRVVRTAVISPADVKVMQPTPAAELNLITCYPFFFIGHAPKRFVVTAVLERPAELPQIQNAGVETRPAFQQSSPAGPPATARLKASNRDRETNHESRYQRSLAATRALNRAAAGDL